MKQAAKGEARDHSASAGWQCRPRTDQIAGVSEHYLYVYRVISPVVIDQLNNDP